MVGDLAGLSPKTEVCSNIQEEGDFFRIKILRDARALTNDEKRTQREK